MKYFEGSRQSPSLPANLRHYRTSFKEVYKPEKAKIAGELNKLPTMRKRVSLVKMLEEDSQREHRVRAADKQMISSFLLSSKAAKQHREEETFDFDINKIAGSRHTTARKMRKELKSIVSSEGASFDESLFHGVRDSWQPGNFESGILVSDEVGHYDAQGIKRRITANFGKTVTGHSNYSSNEPLASNSPTKANRTGL